jgi:hypothetical protein
VVPENYRGIVERCFKGRVHRLHVTGWMSRRGLRDLTAFAKLRVVN